MNFFKRRFFIVMLVISIILILVPTILSSMGLSSYVKNALGVVTQPFTSIMTYVSSAIDGYVIFFDEFDRLEAENRALKNELAAYQEKVYNANLLEEENKWLKNYLGLKREHIDYIMENASVVGREAGNYMTIFTLNRGTLHEISAGMPVVTQQGIVGYVSEVGLTWSKVSTLIETASAVGAYVERSGQLGLIEGDFKLRESGLCNMTYLPADADIVVGDRIISSGIGSIYPRGLVIGEVVEISPDQYSRNLVAKIKPYVDLTDITKAMIVKSFNISTK